MERVIPDGGDGCGDDDGGDRGPLERAVPDSFERADCIEGDGCKTGTQIERALPDGGDGCGDDDGGERGLIERGIPNGCDGCGDDDGGERGSLKRLPLDDIEFAVCSEGDGCKAGRVLEREIPDGGDGCGDVYGGDRGRVERERPDGRPPVAELNDGGRASGRIVGCAKDRAGPRCVFDEYHVCQKLCSIVRI